MSNWEDEINRHTAELVRLTLNAADQGPEPLPEDPGAFWGRADLELDPGEEVYIPSVSAALPRRLGKFPFWRGQEAFLRRWRKSIARLRPLD